MNASMLGTRILSGRTIGGTVVSGAIFLLAPVLLASGLQSVERDSRDSGVHDPTFPRLVASIRGWQVAQGSQQTCGLTLTVSGGTFAPTRCQFEIISGGPPCVDAGTCKPGYAVNLRNDASSFDEIMSVVLFNIRAFESGTYRFEPGAGLEDFKGQLIDKGAVARHLLQGAITLQRLSDKSVRVDCDLRFAGEIEIKATGVLDVKRVNAP